MTRLEYHGRLQHEIFRISLAYELTFHETRTHQLLTFKKTQGRSLMLFSSALDASHHTSSQLTLVYSLWYTADVQETRRFAPPAYSDFCQ